MDQPSHLALAHANGLFARTLRDGDDESSWRWATVVAFYAAHHFTHALFANRAADLPPDTLVPRGRRTKVLSYVNPDSHSMEAGGTRKSLDLLAARYPSLQQAALILANLLSTSYTARYGVNNRLIRFDRTHATHALNQLTNLESIITPLLR